MAGSRVITQPRDRRLLDALAVLAVIDRVQAERLGPFGSLQRANARLLQLVRAGLLGRDVHGTIAGGRKCLYRLPGRQRVRAQAVSHELAISDAYAALNETPPNVSIVEWGSAALPGAGVIPDLRLTVSAADAAHHLFVEIDCGTETLAVFASKVARYLALAISGQSEEVFGAGRFRVLVAASSPRRLAHLSEVISRQTTKLFWLTTIDALRARSGWEPIWQRPDGTDLVSLFEHLCDTVDHAPPSPAGTPDSAKPAGAHTTTGSAPGSTKTPAQPSFAASADHST